MPVILLPPSEGKTAPLHSLHTICKTNDGNNSYHHNAVHTGDYKRTDTAEDSLDMPTDNPTSERINGLEYTHSLQLSSLVFPQLTDIRQRVANALIAASRLPDHEALAVLHAGKRVLPEIRANIDLFDAPTAPAAHIYTGVLYEAAQLKPEDQVLIFSGLFGVTRASDDIPLYRCPMGITLPTIGSLSTVWKKACHELLLEDLQDAVHSHDDVVFDARSSAYCVWPNTSRQYTSNRPKQPRQSAQSMQPTPSVDHSDQLHATAHTAFPFWTLRAVNASGRVITHRAKYYRGLFTRALLDAGSLNNDEIPDLVRVWQRQQGFHSVHIDVATRGITVYV